MTAKWRGAALADLKNIRGYLAPRNAQAAQRVLQAIVVAADGLQLFPHRGRPGRVTGTREIVALREYVIVYSVRGNLVVVERIWHGAQSRQD